MHGLKDIGQDVLSPALGGELPVDRQAGPAGRNKEHALAGIGQGDADFLIDPKGVGRLGKQREVALRI